MNYSYLVPSTPYYVYTRQQSTPLIVVPAVAMLLHTPLGPSLMMISVAPFHTPSGQRGLTQLEPQQMGSPPQLPWHPFCVPVVHVFPTPFACDIAPINAPSFDALLHCAGVIAAEYAARLLLPVLALLATQSAHPTAHASAGTAHGTPSPHAVAGAGALRGERMSATPFHSALQPRTFFTPHNPSHEPSAQPESGLGTGADGGAVGATVGSPPGSLCTPSKV